MDAKLRSAAPILIKGANFVNGDAYLEMQDLLANFENPSIMDVKMVCTQWILRGPYSGPLYIYTYSRIYIYIYIYIYI